MTPTISPSQQSGYLLIAALLLLVCFGILTSAMLHLSLAGIHAGIGHQSHHKAGFLAKSALEQGLNALTLSQDWCDGTLQSPTVSTEGTYHYRCQHYGPTLTTTNQAINDTQTTLPVSDASQLAPFGFVMVGDEIIHYERIEANTLLDITRGGSGTTPQTAQNGALVLQDQYAIEASGHAPNLELPRGQVRHTEVVRLIRDASGYVAAGQKNSWGKLLTFSHGKWVVSYENNNMGYYALSFEDNNNPPTQVAAGFRINTGEIHGNSPWQELPLTPLHNNRIQFLGVSCRFANNCWTVGRLDPPGKPKEAYGVFYRYENGNWLQRATTPTEITLSAIDCPAADLCFAVTEQGHIYRRHGLHGTTWQQVATVPSQPPLSAISCPDAFGCFITSTLGQIFYYNGQLTTIASLQPPHALRAIHCLSANQCLIGGDKGLIVRLNNGHVTTEPTPGQMDIRGVHCLAANDCMAVGLKSSVSYRFSENTWSPYALGAQYDLHAISAPKSATQSLGNAKIALVMKHDAG